jgi:sarcosine oxidase subunit gamma
MANAQQSSMLSGQTSLSGRAPYSSANPDGGPTGLVVREIAELGKINIRGGASMAPALKANTGCDFPPEPNNVVSAGARHIVWLGPDEFLLLCEAGREDDLHRTIRNDLGDQHFSITVVTDGLCALQLSGPALRQVLAKGCALDLHPRSFGIGDCAQTALSHAGVTLIAMDDDRFTMICRTSFAPYVLDWLQDAAIEYGFEFKG